jgi:hypothetical protein
MSSQSSPLVPPSFFSAIEGVYVSWGDQLHDLYDAVFSVSLPPTFQAISDNGIMLIWICQMLGASATVTPLLQREEEKQPDPGSEMDRLA